MWVRKRKPRPITKAAKGQAGKDALDKLNSYLDASAPEPVYWLQHLWGNQQKAITYKEIRQAIVNGHMSQNTLKAWQQDYAKFVNQTMTPIWTTSMEAANTALTAKHPGFFFNPMQASAQAWITDHGAQWVSNVTQEQSSAIAAMLKPGLTGQYTVDELSRVIRPCIGLTEAQSKANLNYYNSVKQALMDANPNMKEATAEKRALDASLKYAEKQHAGRAFTIATTEMAFAYNQGAEEGIKQAQDQGFMGKTTRKWQTADDETVCDVCAALDGVVLEMDQEFSYKGKTLYAGQKKTPPAHPRCRCVVIYEETEAPEFEGIEVAPDQLDQPLPQQAPDPNAATPSQLPGMPTNAAVQSAPAPQIPSSAGIPNGMTLNGQVHLGGTGEMYSYTDASGQEWLFKPAQTKSGKPEAFRAFSQEAGYKVQAIVDPDSAVTVGTGTLGGKFGAFQQRVQNIDPTIDLKAWQGSSDQLPGGFTPQLQREGVTDWLLGNYDSHGGNFLVDKNGLLIGVDKEQSFRYIGNPNSAKMSYSYHPNASYGEKEPIYNTMYRRYAKGEIDVDLQDTLCYIKRVEAIPDAEYREMFRDYAEGLKGKGAETEKLLDQITTRKSTVRETYRTFYSELLTERTGKKQSFIWADEAAQHAQQPVSAVLQDVNTLKKMTKADLMQLAKQKKIAYYNNMDIDQLVTSISDPTQAPAMSQQVKDRLKANAAARRAAQQAAAAPPKPRDVYMAEDIFKDANAIPKNMVGVPVASDKGMVEGLNLTARKMNIGGQEVFEVSGKLSDTAWKDVLSRMQPNAAMDAMEFERADIAAQLFSGSDTIGLSSVDLRCLKCSNGNTQLEVYTNGGGTYYAWNGYFRVRTPSTGSGQFDASEIADMLKSAGLGDLVKNPTGADELLFKKSRLVWQNAPNRVKDYAGLSGKSLSDKLDDIMKQEGIDPARLSRMKLKKVYEGYSTYVEDGVGAEYQKAGLRYIWAGVERSESIIGILASPGFSSTNTRCKMGMSMTGASPGSDMGTGGSDSVFTRIAVKTKQKLQYRNSFMGGKYRILMDPSIMERTDWYAYTGDSFGTTRPSSMGQRLKPVDFIQSMANSYQSGNEIMFRNGIPKESFIGISCETNAMKAELMRRFRISGIKTINGIDVDQFVKVGSYI